METPSEVESTEPSSEMDAEPAAEQQAPAYDGPPEGANLAPHLPPDFLETLGHRVKKLKERDWESSTQFRLRRANQLKLFAGILPPKDPDFAEVAQVHLSIMAKAVLRVHARIYDQRFPARGGILNAMPTGPEDTDRATRISKHLNWQLRNLMPEYIPGHDAGMLQWLLYGSAFTYTYWNQTESRPCVEFIPTDDVILPYTHKSVSPSLADVPRITRILRLYRHELEELQDTGYYANIDELYEDDDGQGSSSSTLHSNETQQSPVTEAVHRIEGVEPNADTSDDDVPRVLLEQHCWLKLPGNPRQRPVIVTVDELTSKVIGVFLREDEDPIDRARYEREMSSWQASQAAAQQQYQMELAQHQQAQMQPQGMTQPPMPGGPPTASQPPMPGGPPSATQPPMPGAANMTQPPAMPPPVMPEPPPQPKEPKRVPINFFTHYVCFPNPEGIYGLGIGWFLEGPNMAADTLMGQLVDAASIANIPTFVFSRQSGLKRGKYPIKPGQGTEVEWHGGKLADHFHFITFPPPNPAMHNIVKHLESDAEETSGAGDILAGDVGGSRETATTTKIRSAMAMSQIAILGRRYDKSQTEEAKKIARLNSVYLNDEDYFYVIEPNGADPNHQQGPTKITRADYIEDFDISFTADPRLASQPQRIEEANSAMSAVMSLPPPLQSPALLVAAAKGVFKALERDDLAALIDQIPAPPLPVPGISTGAPGGAPGHPGGGGPPPPHGGNGKPKGPPGPAPAQGPPQTQAGPMEGPPPLQIGG